jgi:hypothetical protein
MSKVSKSENVPEKMKPLFDAIISLTDEVCKKHLNEEYATLAHHATAALARKRPSPLLQGKANTWACGIVYALGFVNFLFDKSQEPYMNATDLCKAFGVSASTGSAKSRIVRDKLDMVQMAPNWCLPSNLEDNPLAWHVMVNGFIVDARSLPLEIQEEAHRKGLIPYVPGKK